MHLVLRLLPILFLAASAISSAQTPWPARPVRVVVPFSPGAFTDIAARSFGVELSAQLGQTFVVDNRTGAGGILGMDIVAKATPDGYTCS